MIKKILKGSLMVIGGFVVLLFLLVGIGSCNVNESESTEPVQPNEVSQSTSKEEEVAYENVVLYENNGIKIENKGFFTGEEDSFSFGPYIKLAVENNSDKNIVVQVRDCSVNGYMLDPMCSIEVVANKKANGDMTWFDSDFEENGISKVENIEFYFDIFDAETYNTIVETEVITLTF